MYVYDPNLHVHALGIKAIIIMRGEPSLVAIDVCTTQRDFKGNIFVRVDRNMWRYFEGCGISRCGDILRKYGRWASWKSSSIVTVWTTAIDMPTCIIHAYK